MSRPAVELPRRWFVSRLLTAAAGLALPFGRQAEAGPTSADEAYLGDLMLVPYTYAPKNWANCNGQLLLISQYQNLFTVIETRYGGDGVLNFALPNLRDRFIIHSGQGPGLSLRTLGEIFGATATTLIASQLAPHTHTARASGLPGTVVNPSAAVVPAHNGAQVPAWGSTIDGAMAAASMTSVGGNQAHSNVQPYVTMRWVICIAGLFPSPS